MIEEFFMFDGESLGLHGPAFQVAGGIFTRKGVALSTFCFGVHIELLKEEAASPEDIQWVKENCNLGIATHDSLREMRDAFWDFYLFEVRRKGIPIIADCQWPVEAKLLTQCIMDNYEARKNFGPYPVHELATLLAACRMDPTGVFTRQENELPVHHPLNDARQSARLVAQCLEILGI